jgi:uncharacterized protein YbjQ (UPF0145 family)
MRFAAAAALTMILVAPTALAREDAVQISVQYVKDNADQSRVLQNISWHMNGERHRGVAQRYNLAATTKSTNAAFKSDEAACSRAFLSAIIQLQTAARNMGADGVIEIKSNAAGQTYEKADNFLCTAGNILARVSLTGVPVKFK